MKKKIAVIGGGLAGISAAYYLNNQLQIDLFEARKSLGGRVHSFYDDTFGDELDNGMHLMIGAYTETLNLLSAFNSARHVQRFDLNIPFISPDGDDKYRLYSSFLPGPFHMLYSILKSGKFAFTELLSLFKLTRVELQKDISCRELLDRFKQSEKAITSIWEPLILATLNATMDTASAKNLISVLKKGFLAGRDKAALFFPTRPFDDIFAKPAYDWLKQKGVAIHFGSPVREISSAKNGMIEIRVGEKILTYDAVVISTPADQLNKLNSNLNLSFDFSPITSFYFEAENGAGVLPINKITALLGSPLHWIFNMPQENRYSVTASASDLNMDKQQLQTELKRFFPGTWEISAFKRICIKRATTLLSPDKTALRSLKSSTKGIFIAGDWTDTGLPATIESAVISGKKAAEEVIEGLIG